MIVDIPDPRAPLLPLCPAFVQFTDCSRLVTAKLESVPQLRGEAEQEMVRGVLDIYISTYPGYLHIYISWISTNPLTQVWHMWLPHVNPTVVKTIQSAGFCLARVTTTWHKYHLTSLRRSWILIHELILIPLARCSDLQP